MSVICDFRDAFLGVEAQKMNAKEKTREGLNVYRTVYNL